MAKAIASSVNLLSLIFAQVYFPTYSNGLKEIARFLGFEWTDPFILRPSIHRLASSMGRIADPTVREKADRLQR